MNSYTVKQVSQLLKTNEETVRRWIRSGKLSATLESKKGGHTISSESLNDFINQAPKYAPILSASLAASTLTMSAVIGSVIGGFLALADSNRNLSAGDVESFLKRKISVHEKSLKKKEIQLRKLQEEIETESQDLAKYQYALENLDLNEIANSMNSAKHR